MHSDTAYKTFSPVDFVQISGLSETTIAKFERLGLISGSTRKGREKVFGTCDLIRVKFVVRCKKAGYTYKAIRALIGTTNGATSEADKVGKCLDFAQNRLYQIRRRMEELQGLERVNLQLDEKLISNYIKELKSTFPPRGIPPIVKSIPVRPPPAAKPPPPVKKERRHEESPAQPQVRLVPPRDTKLRTYQWGAALLTFLVVGLTVLAFFLIKDRTPEESAPDRGSFSAQYSNTEAITEADTDIPESAVADSSPPSLFSGAEPQDVEAPEAAGNNDTAISAKPIIIKTNAIEPLALLEIPDSGNDIPAERPLEKVAADDLDKMISGTGGADPAFSGTAPGEIETVTIEDFKISFNQQNKILRATFNLIKGDGANDRLRGGTVLILKPEANAPEDQWLRLPDMNNGAQHSGRKSYGIPFSISRFKTQNHLTRLEEDPGRFRNATVQIYSNSGQLISESVFTVNIRYEPIKTAAIPSDTGKPTSGSAGELTASNTADTDKTAVSAPPGTDTNETVMQVDAETPKEITVTETDETIAALTDTGPAAVDADEAASAEEDQNLQPSDLEDEKGDTPLPQSDGATSSPDSESRPIKPTEDPDAKKWARQSYQHVLDGNYKDAIDAATKAMRLDPGLINPYISRAIAYTESRMYDEAIEDCNRALDINPDNAVALNNRGLANQKKGMTAEAKSDYRRACELGLSIGCKNREGLERSEKINILLNQSKTSFENQEWDNVIRATTDVLSIDPDNVAAYTNRSAAYAQKGFLNKALKDGNMAIKLDPSFALAYHNRGYIFELMEEIKKAAADYEKGCSLGLEAGCDNYTRLTR